jgi:hypothetical protein
MIRELRIIYIFSYDQNVYNVSINYIKYIFEIQQYKKVILFNFK